MSRLMEISKSLGHSVSGSDEAHLGHKKENVSGADMVVYSSAVKNDNVELLEAKRRGIPAVERAQFLGAVAEGYEKVIAVSGTHGKTTTAAMLSLILSDYPITTHVGGEVTQRNGGSIFVTEACEYRRSFLALSPDISVILNAEYDHPDCYGSEEEYRQAFVEFAGKSKLIIVNGDDSFLRGLKHKNKITFGMSRENDFYARKIEGGFSVWYKDIFLGEIALAVLGSHNVMNALASTVVALTLGASVSVVSNGLSAFTGVKRRTEYLGEREGRKIFSDYAHHPTEIDCALSVFTPAPLVVFEPHTYSRLRAFADGFVRSLERAKEVLLLPVYGAREVYDGEAIKLLYDGLKEKVKTTLLSGYDEVLEKVLARTNRGETVLFMGAGSIDTYARKIIEK